MPAFILPAPSTIVQTTWKLRYYLFAVHLPATFKEVALAFVISLTVGAGLAVLMHLWEPAEQALYPLVVASQTIPLIAIAPVFLLWFGFGLGVQVAAAVLWSFFTVTVNTFDGLRAADPDLREMLRAMGAGRWQVLRLAEAPAAMPLFFSGLKVTAAFAVSGATIGEWLGGERGLGYFGRRMSATLNAPAVFAAALVLAVLGIACFMAVAWAERAAMPWQRRRTAAAGRPSTRRLPPTAS